MDECEYQCGKVCVGARVGSGGISCDDLVMIVMVVLRGCCGHGDG